MGNLSGESREQSRKDKVTRFRSVTYARQLGLLVNTLGSHLKSVFLTSSKENFFSKRSRSLSLRCHDLNIKQQSNFCGLLAQSAQSTRGLDSHVQKYFVVRSDRILKSLLVEHYRLKISIRTCIAFDEGSRIKTFDFVTQHMFSFQIMVYIIQEFVHAQRAYIELWSVLQTSQVHP